METDEGSLQLFDPVSRYDNRKHKGEQHCQSKQPDDIVRLELLIAMETDEVSHDHMRQPVHTGVKLVVCCTRPSGTCFNGSCIAPDIVIMHVLERLLE